MGFYQTALASAAPHTDQAPSPLHMPPSSLSSLSIRQAKFEAAAFVPDSPSASWVPALIFCRAPLCRHAGTAVRETRLPGRGGDMQVEGKASLGNGRDSHLLGLKWLETKELHREADSVPTRGERGPRVWAACGVAAGTDRPPAGTPTHRMVTVT